MVGLVVMCVALLPQVVRPASATYFVDGFETASSVAIDNWPSGYGDCGPDGASPGNWSSLSSTRRMAFRLPLTEYLGWPQVRTISGLYGKATRVLSQQVSSNFRMEFDAYAPDFSAAPEAYLFRDALAVGSGGKLR